MLLLTPPNGNGRCVLAEKQKSFLEKFRELFLQDAHSLFEAVGEGLTGDADLSGNGGIAQALFTQSADFDSLWHDFTQAVEDLSHVNGVGHIVRRRRGLQIRHLFLQMVKPVHLIAVIVLKTGIKGTHVAGSVVQTAVAVHVAGETLGRRTDAAPVVLLGTAVGVDIAVIVVELFFGARDALLGGAEIDVVLIVIGFHRKSPPFFDFSKRRTLSTAEKRV